MKLFEMKDWELQVLPQAWGLSPFKKLLDKDTTKDKSIANKEMQFVWHFSDIKSDYNYILDENVKWKELRKDLKLPARWRYTKDVQAAVAFYRKRSTTITSVVLEDTYYTAQKLSSLMRKKVDEEGLNVAEIGKLTEGIKKMPDVIKAIQKTEEAVLKEKIEKSDTVGSQQKALYEEGLNFDED